MAGMTLVEVMVATAIFGLIFGSVLTGLWQASYRTTWTTLSVEAARFAEERIEQTQNARWDPTALPVVDEVVSTNFPLRTGALFEFSSGGSVLATNTLTITTLTNTYGGTYRAIASTVVWKYRGRGPFTNNVVTIRAQD